MKIHEYLYRIVPIFENQIRTSYEGSKLSQMKQDIAKSRVKYGGSGSEIQRDFSFR